MSVQSLVMATIATAEVALFDGDKEVADPDYQRAHWLDWTVNGTTATALAEWGPFGAFCRFDRVVLITMGSQVEDLPLPSRVEVGKGRMFEYQLTART